MLIAYLNAAFKAATKLFEVEKDQCLWSTRPKDRSAPHYDYLITADKRRDGYVITGEVYVDEKHVDTRFRFEKRGLTLSEALDVIYTLDKANGLFEDESYAYQLMTAPDIRYFPTRFSYYEGVEDIEKTFCTSAKQYLHMCGFRELLH